MIYSDFVYYIAISLVPVLAIYFLIILFAGSGYRIHSFVILTSCLIALMMPESSDDSLKEFLRIVNTSILLDGVTAFSLAMVLFFDKLAWKQSVLLSFATAVHIMIIYDITIASSVLSLFFYNFYDELIITIGILQIMVSYNGFNTALRNVREYISRASFYFRCNSKGFSLFQNNKGRP